ncbi:MAG: glucose-6-phosphate isomerase, partial [Chlamydiia bacterium]|nr:glucose-6-phosphate isomerase [Chlamydiia bacterium]
ERIDKWVVEGAGWKLLYGSERIDEAVMEALLQLANERALIDRMAALQRGEPLNVTEKRAADHPALRGGNSEHHRLAKQEIDKLKGYSFSCTDLIVVGIGGSQLGPEAVCEALGYLPKRCQLHFLSNLDADEFERVLAMITLSTTTVVVISKSGSTWETEVNEQLLRKKFTENGLESRSHFVAVTTKGSKLDREDDFEQIFYLFDWVGGRFSTTSMVGGVVLKALYGMEFFSELLEGAAAMDNVALEEGNPALITALLNLWNHNYLGYSSRVIVPYASALKRWPAHIQQVAMESNGKRVDLEGKPVTYPTEAIVWGEAGTCAQHSFFQLLHQGTAVVPVEFIGFKRAPNGDTVTQKKLLANLIGQAIALAKGEGQAFPGNRPSRMLLTDSLSPYRLGALLAFYEHQTAFLGFLLNINSFDQEGVQLGKKLAKNVMQETNDPLIQAYLDHVQN